MNARRKPQIYSCKYSKSLCWYQLDGYVLCLPSASLTSNSQQMIVPLKPFLILPVHLKGK